MEEPNRSAVLNIKFSRDRSKLAVARNSCQVEMWIVSNGECRWSTDIIQHTSTNNGIRLAFSADDSKLAYKNGDKIIVFDAESGKECNSEDTFDFKSTNDHVHRVGYVSSARKLSDLLI